MHDVCVAVETSMLSDAPVSRLDLDWLVKILEREGQ
jgi:hypothetical protein